MPEDVAYTHEKKASQTRRRKAKKESDATALLIDSRVAVRRETGSFVNFLREKAVVGLAVGFIIGLQAQAVVRQLVDSFITPILNAVLGNNLEKRQFLLIPGSPETAVTWGKFIYVLINFIVVLFSIYVIVKVFKLDRLDTPPPKKK